MLSSSDFGIPRECDPKVRAYLGSNLYKLPKLMKAIEMAHECPKNERLIRCELLDDRGVALGLENGLADLLQFG